MALSILVAGDAVLSENWLSTFFQKRPSDLRYDWVKLQSFYPIESLANASQVTFCLPRFLGPCAYMPSGMLLKMDVKLSMIDPSTKKR